MSESPTGRRLHFNDQRQYRALRSALIPEKDAQDREHGAFLFASPTKNGALNVVDIVVLSPGDFEAQTAYHLRLSSEVLQKMIVRAHRTGTALIEAHSHPLARGSAVCFSPFDCEELAEAGPHMAWRLPGRPYVALVFGQDAFDSLYWEGPDRRPQGSVDLVVGNYLLQASRESERAWGRDHG